MSRVLATFLCVLTTFRVALGQTDPVFEKAIALPDVLIEGEHTHIHSQGLYVTAKHFYVTGRLERAPKRALLLRFDRENTSHYEVLDITPPKSDQDSGIQDHPGGFDFDGKYFWIPVAESRRNSSAAIVRVDVSPDRPLMECSHEIVFRVDDHVGAIAIERSKRRLYGANWDTEEIYIWDYAGKLLRRIPRSEFVENDSQWTLAVQDWKFAGDTLVAGGIDKPRGQPQQAVIDLIRNGTRFRRIPLANRKDVARPLTNEGLALFDDQLFLLPEDLGRGARVLQFSVTQQTFSP